jgi:hypothetical protein
MGIQIDPDSKLNVNFAVASAVAADGKVSLVLDLTSLVVSGGLAVTADPAPAPTPTPTPTPSGA